MSSTSIPILVVGADDSVTVPFAEAALPDIDGTSPMPPFRINLTSTVIHVCQTIPIALIEIPHLLAANPITLTPACSLGSNVTRTPSTRRRPVAIIIGGVYSAEDTAAIKNIVGTKVAVIKADTSRDTPGESPVNGAERLRETFEEMGMTADGVEEGVISEGRGGLWYY